MLAAQPPSEILVGIAEDHVVFRNAIKAFLHSTASIKVIIEAGNGQELIDQLATSQPEIILLDIEMPLMNGIQALTLIRQQYPQIKIIMLSMHNDHSVISQVMSLGASTYLTKTSELNIISETIHSLYGDLIS